MPVDCQQIPLSLYIHVPWCARKCPYCDFNSHALEQDLPQTEFVDALLADLQTDTLDAAGRPLETIFIGGGTPSLLSGEAVVRLLDGVRERIQVSADCEITLEANPGSAEADRFAAYRSAGVNRLSIGVQSFHAGSLGKLGRIHGPEEAVAAVHQAREAGFEHINLDLMFGLPGQVDSTARADLQRALALNPGHISYYQLTLEPNTRFYHQPPELPDDEAIWRMQQRGQADLAAKGYRRYEISAHALEGRACRHNLNYWRFGDYLGIGPGAHGKLSLQCGGVMRRIKQRHPRDYLAAAATRSFISSEQRLDHGDLRFEFMLNALRLVDGFSLDLYRRRTGLRAVSLEAGLVRAEALELVNRVGQRILPSTKGLLFHNDLLQLFLDESRDSDRA